mgnify:CR=1 FL=1
MTTAFDLAACQQILGLSVSALKTKLDIAHGETHEDVAYEGLEGVTQYYNPKSFPGRVYVRDGAVQMVYVPSGAALAGVSVRDLTQKLTGKAKEMRSRAGKEFTHYIYAGQGVAFSADGDELCFVEVFRGRALKAYLAEIYQDPGPFIR